MQDCDWLVVMDQMNEIDSNLWMGAAPIRIAPPMFAFVVNVNDHLDYSFAKSQMILHIKLDDCQIIPDEAVLHLLADFVNSARKVGPVLVHCQAGLNRSGIVTALALMKSGLSANDAIAKMRTARGPDVLCNPWFVTWLQAQNFPALPLKGQVVVPVEPTLEMLKAGQIAMEDGLAGTKGKRLWKIYSAMLAAHSVSTANDGQR